MVILSRFELSVNFFLWLNLELDVLIVGCLTGGEKLIEVSVTVKKNWMSKPFTFPVVLTALQCYCSYFFPGIILQSENNPGEAHSTELSSTDTANNWVKHWHSRAFRRFHWPHICKGYIVVCYKWCKQILCSVKSMDMIDWKKSRIVFLWNTE